MSNTNSGSHVLVRQRQAADVDDCAAILEQVHRGDGYPVEGVADPVTWLSPAGLIQAWVAEVAGKIVGHVAVSEAEEPNWRWSLRGRETGRAAKRTVLLERLFVSSEARGSGVGFGLVNTATTYAKERDWWLLLEVMEKDKAAIALYERMGWRRLGSVEHVYEGGSTPALCFVSP